jgi:GTPase-associated protein 1
MAKFNSIVIDQTLHGYNNGHKLISGSTEIVASEKRIMQNLSDYSGSGIEKKFLSYLTGYPLPFSKFYVFAKTWYADEMTRPGCVWTHSLLINFTDLLLIRNMESLLDYFERPEYDNFNKYATKIDFFEREESKNTVRNNVFYKLTNELYNTSELCTILLADSSEEFQKEILQIWDWQWPRLKRSFSFCSGSLSLRKVEEFNFDIQVIPNNRERIILYKTNDTYRIIDFSEKEDFNQFIQDYKQTNLEDLYSFMVRYGSDVNGKRRNYKPLFNAFLILRDPRKITINWIIDYFGKYFSESDEAKLLKAHIVESYVNHSRENKYELVKLLISNKSFSNVKWDLKTIIKSLWSLNQIDQKEFIEVIKDLHDAKLDEIIPEILKDVPSYLWIDGNFSMELYLELINSSLGIEKETYFWTRSEEFQKDIFDVLRTRKNTNWEDVINSMLESNSDVLALEIYELAGIKTVKPLVEWLVHHDTSLPFRWRSILNKNKAPFFNCLLRQESFSKTVLKLALEIFTPTDKLWRSISFSEIEGFVTKLSHKKIEPEVTGIYTLLMTSCYTGNTVDPARLNSIIFQKLHNNLENDIVHRDTWERFKWSLGRDVNSLVVPTFMFGLFGGSDIIPEWDRCEFLRRAFLAVLIKYDWDPNLILDSIKDKNTFEKFVEFTSKLSIGRDMFNHILKNIDKGYTASSFHYNTIKKYMRY